LGTVLYLCGLRVHVTGQNVSLETVSETDTVRRAQLWLLRDSVAIYQCSVLIRTKYTSGTAVGLA